MTLMGLVFLFYGDSLTIQTWGDTRGALLAAGAAEVRFITDYPEFVTAEGGDWNGGDSNKALRFFTTQDVSDVDFVVLNTGLHDMNLLYPNSRERNVCEEQYEKNLRDIRSLLGDKLIWRETFPTYGIPEGNNRDKDDVDRYNLIARYALPGVLRVAQFPILPEEFSPDGVHLAVAGRVGAEVARQITSGEIARGVTIGIGTVIELDAPGVLTVDPNSGGAVLKSHLTD